MKREIVVWTVISWIFAGIFVCAMAGGDAGKAGGEKVDDKLEDYVTERNEQYKEELELWLRKWLVENSPIPVLIPEPVLCTDNAAMIAACGYYRFQVNRLDGLDLDVVPSLKLA